MKLATFRAAAHHPQNRAPVLSRPHDGHFTVVAMDQPIVPTASLSAQVARSRHSLDVILEMLLANARRQRRGSVMCEYRRLSRCVATTPILNPEPALLVRRTAASPSRGRAVYPPYLLRLAQRESFDVPVNPFLTHTEKGLPRV